MFFISQSSHHTNFR
ncbi:hypothetical protein M8C21_010764 [Ambrosia artemisiifolia]|uniref:Uncharacterized protein n=1 Tax=Ambrosia artemisiifolia TaxID=4212 RepID=A0AAD5GGF5_AMBAR|nr:hypothetical protein M8C21_010764 [Ambrosia artemisiifolia]